MNANNQEKRLSGLIIRSPHIERILREGKTWEVRGTRTRKRGTIALVEAGARRIVGACKVIGVRGPLGLEEMRDNLNLHQSPDDLEALPYKKTYAWILADAVEFIEPIPFENPPGAVVWVKLPRDIAKLVRSRIANSRLTS